MGPSGDHREHDALVSAATLPPRYRRGLLWVLVGAVAFTWASAAPSGYWWGAGVVSAFLVAVILPVARMRVEIRSAGDAVALVVIPIARRRLSLDLIVDVSVVEAGGGLGDGLGLRRLGKRTWGALVGGPAVRLRLRSGTSWVVSAPDARGVVRWFARQGPPGAAAVAARATPTA